MNRFAIFVTVKLKPGCVADFLPLILDNATSALRDEPDCHLFHVMQAKDDDHVFHFFEVYTDESALETHREQPHFKRYQHATADMIAERSVQPVSVVNPTNVAETLL